MGAVIPAAVVLTDFQRGVLAELVAYTGREKQGDGPWQRAWVRPRSPAQSRAMAKLYQLGLIDRKYGRPSAKLPHSYRWRMAP